MQNSKAKIIIRNGYYYAILKIKDNFGLAKQKWLNLGKTECNSSESVSIVANQKICEYYAQNIKKTAIVSKKIANRRSNSQLLFSKFAEIWLQYKRKSIQINTYDDYVYDLKAIKQFFDSQALKIKDVKPCHIEGFFSFLYSKGTANNTILHYFVLLNQIFKFAIKNDVINHNVMDRIDRPKKEKYEHKYYTAVQVQKLLNCLEQKNSFLKIPVSLTAIYGLRRSEIVGLLWDSIDFENGKLSINHKVIETNKNGKAILYHSDKMKNDASKRDLPLTDHAQKILLDAKKQIEINKQKFKRKYNLDYTAYVCVDKKGKLISPHRLTTCFAKFLKENNFPKIRFHDLRHSCASMMVANGVSMKSVQEWLGHSNFGTTANTYSHLDFSSKQQSAIKIEQLISKNDISSNLKEKCQNFKTNEQLNNLLLALIQKIENLQLEISKLS